jgi:hypothetical protein
MWMRRRPKGLRGLGSPLETLRFRLEDPIARADFAARLRERGHLSAARLAERGDLPGLLLLAMAWGGDVPFIPSS